MIAYDILWYTAHYLQLTHESVLCIIILFQTSIKGIEIYRMSMNDNDGYDGYDGYDDKDEYIDFSFAQKDTLIFQNVAEIAESTTPTAPTLILPKKTPLERRDFNQSVSTAMWVKENAATPHIASHGSHVPQAVSKLGTEIAKPKMLDSVNLKKILKNVMTDPLYKNSLFTMASTFILGGLGFVFWIIVARLYKTEDVGIATTVISIMTLLSSFTILGLNASLNRYLPKSAAKNDLINSSFVIVTLVTLVTAGIVLLYIQGFSAQLVFLRSNIVYAISFIVLVIFYAWNNLVESIFMAFRAAGNILIKNSIISIAKLVLPFALIAFGAYGIFASTALALALGVCVSLVIIVLRFKIRPSMAVNVSLIRETSAYSIANYITDFMFNMPSLVLPAIILNVLSARYAAYYYIASMIQSTLLIIPLATAQALLTEGSYDEAELRKHVKKACITIVVILLPATAVIIFGGNILLQFFGKNYASEAFQFLQLYSASTLFTALILICNAIMNIKHQIKLLVISNILESLLTLYLSYAFITGKLVGIGWGWTLGQAIAGVFSLFFIMRNYLGSAKAQ